MVKTRDVRNEYMPANVSILGSPIEDKDKEKKFQELLKRRYDLLCPTCGAKLKRRYTSTNKAQCSVKTCRQSRPHAIY